MTTISDNLEPNKPTYSQITQKQLNIPRFNDIDDSEWADILQAKIDDKINTPFDNKLGPMRKSLRHSKLQLESVTLLIINYLLHQLNS